MMWRVLVTEVLDVRAWVKDIEGDYSHIHSKEYIHMISAGTPQEALNIVERLYEGKQWSNISTHEKLGENHFFCHDKNNKDLWDATYDKYFK